MPLDAGLALAACATIAAGNSRFCHFSQEDKNMGLLDAVLSAALSGGGQQQQQGNLGGAILGSLLGGDNQQQGASALSGILNQLGGINGLVNILSKSGLGDQVQSWIGTGSNQPVSADQLQSALGNDQLGNIAQQLGLDQGQVAGVLAHMLPDLINHLTPNGQVPQGGVANGQAGSDDLIGMLGGLLGGR